MTVSYSHGHKSRYECRGHVLRHDGKVCQGMNGKQLDQCVGEELLRVVEPGALDLAIQAIADVRRERERLEKNWKQNLERAKYESTIAERAYRAVDPENRLVARTLEQQWEAALRQERTATEEYERFRSEPTGSLTKSEVGKIQSLAVNLPKIWNSPTTTNIDRQEVARCLIEKVIVSVPNKDENVRFNIVWVGGHKTEHTFRRAVFSYESLEHYEEILEIVVSGRKNGLTNSQVAKQLNDKGFRPPAERSPKFTRALVSQMTYRLGLAPPRRADLLGQNEFWLREFGQSLGVKPHRVRYWIKKNYINWRQLPGGQYVVWADSEELQRLEKLCNWPSRKPAPENLTRTKTRPRDEKFPAENPKMTKRREFYKQKKRSEKLK